MRTPGSVIAEYRKKNKLTQPMLSEKLRESGLVISYKTISGWEQGISEPGVTAFAEMCRILGVKDIYEAIYGENPFDPATRLNTEGQEKLNDYASLLLDSHKYDKAEPVITPASSPAPAKKRLFKLFDTRVSAGTGNFLENDSYEWIEGDSSTPKKADFALKVTGDSMEPLYKDKSIVWVQKRETLVSGNIGIFCLNGNAYCKKYVEKNGDIFLVSLNKKYAPIQVHEGDEFRIFGKVLN